MRPLACVALLALLGLGCDQDEQATAPGEPAAGDQPAPAPEPPKEPEIRNVTQSGAVASFIDDELDECITMTTTYNVRPEVEWEPPDLRAKLEALAEKWDDREVLILQKTCDEQFGGRTMLAGCVQSVQAPTESVPDGVAGGAVVASQMYRFATALADDSRMRDCLAAGGEWTAIPEDSREYRRAELEHRAEGVRRAADRLRR